MNSDVIEQKKRTILKLTSIMNKLFVVLEEFRRNLNDFQKSCQCVENHKNKLNFNELENNYKTFVEEYNQQKSEINGQLGLIESTADRPTTDPKTTGEVISCEYKDCVYKTLTQRCLKNHISRMHSTKSRIKCKKCRFQCWGTTRLNEHNISAHPLIQLNDPDSNHSQPLPLKTDHSIDSLNSLSDYETNCTELQNIDTNVKPIECSPNGSNSCDKNGDNFVFGSNLFKHLRHRKVTNSSEPNVSDVKIEPQEPQLIPEEEEVMESNDGIVSEQRPDNSKEMSSHQKLVNTSRKSKAVISEPIKELIIKRLSDGMSSTDVAVLFNVKANTARKIFERYRRRFPNNTRKNSETTNSESSVCEANVEVGAEPQEDQFLANQMVIDSNDSSLTQQKSSKKKSFVERKSNGSQKCKPVVYQKISEEIRELIIKNLSEGMSSSDVALLFNVKANTARKMYCRYRQYVRQRSL